jgi:hypothetical protein
VQRKKKYFGTTVHDRLLHWAGVWREAGEEKKNNLCFDVESLVVLNAMVTLAVASYFFF